jgi:hypothetical protein
MSAHLDQRSGQPHGVEVASFNIHEADRGKIWVAPDAFDPLTGEDLEAWSGPLFPEPPKRRPRAPTQRRQEACRLW